MPREKKQHLKKRKDGRFACRYKNIWFYGETEEEALALRKMYREQEKNRVSDAPVSVADYAAGFLERTASGLRPGTVYGRKSVMKKLTALYGEKLLREVTPSDIKALYSIAFKGLSSDYINHAKSLYVSFFTAALEDGLCSFNPAVASSAKPHKGTTGSHRAITPAEREWIETLCTDHPLFPAIMVMLYAGLRPQEAKALDLDKSVDLQAGVLRVEQFMHRAGPTMQEFSIDSEGKTKKATRSVPVFPPVAAALAGRHGMLIPGRNGPLDQNGWRSVWNSYRSAMETAINGMSHKKYLRRAAKVPMPPWISFSVKPYDLRHSFVTWCRDYGVELHTVIEWVGHADSRMVLKIYDEVSNDRSRLEAEKLVKTAFRSQNGSQAQNKKPAGP